MTPQGLRRLLRLLVPYRFEQTKDNALKGFFNRELTAYFAVRPLAPQSGAPSVRRPARGARAGARGARGRGLRGRAGRGRGRARGSRAA